MIKHLEHMKYPLLNFFPHQICVLYFNSNTCRCIKIFWKLYRLCQKIYTMRVLFPKPPLMPKPTGQAPCDPLNVTELCFQFLITNKIHMAIDGLFLWVPSQSSLNSCSVKDWLPSTRTAWAGKCLDFRFIWTLEWLPKYNEKCFLLFFSLLPIRLLDSFDFFKQCQITEHRTYSLNLHCSWKEHKTFWCSYKSWKNVQILDVWMTGNYLYKYNLIISYFLPSILSQSQWHWPFKLKDEPPFSSS